MKAALAALRQQEPGRLIAAVPIAPPLSPFGVRRLRDSDGERIPTEGGLQTGPRRRSVAV